MVMNLVREEELDVRNAGIYPKFGIIVNNRVKYGDSEWWTNFIFRFFIKGIKSEKMQKLVFLLYILSYPSSDAGMSDILKKRVDETKKHDRERYQREIISHNYMEENLEALEIEEIMEILTCSRSLAKEYKNTLKAIMWFFW